MTWNYSIAETTSKDCSPEDHLDHARGYIEAAPSWAHSDSRIDGIPKSDVAIAYLAAAEQHICAALEHGEADTKTRKSAEALRGEVEGLRRSFPPCKEMRQLEKLLAMGRASINKSSEAKK